MAGIMKCGFLTQVGVWGLGKAGKFTSSEGFAKDLGLGEGGVGTAEQAEGHC